MSSKRAIGSEFESLAEEHLCDQGCELVVRNFHSRLGEIDLILIEQQTIIFAEVKYRSNNSYGHPSEMVTPAKQRKIIKTAQLFLQKNPKYGLLDARFDVVSIQNIKPGSHHNIEWFKAAFTT